MTRKASGTRKNMQRKTRRLEDLFRPPCEILFLGTFLEAREYAKSMNRWLLVNVQNPQEFACQILNRDVWPNAQIREMIDLDCQLFRAHQSQHHPCSPSKDLYFIPSL